jgi:hypothetical protein
MAHPAFRLRRETGTKGPAARFAFFKKASVSNTHPDAPVTITAAGWIGKGSRHYVRHSRLVLLTE